MKQAGFLHSLRYLAIGWQLVQTPGLRRFVWTPLVINISVFGLLGWWIIGSLGAWIDGWALFSAWSDWWIISLLQNVLKWLLGFLIVFLLAYCFTLLANLIGAPFNSLLSERVEAHLTGQAPEPAPSWISLLQSVPRLMTSEMSKLIYLVICLLPLFILQWIPLLNLIAPALLFLFGAWMFALEYLDYPMGNHGAVFRDVRQKLRRRRRVAYGFGCGVAVASMIPLVNLVVMPVAVAGATALYVDHLEDV